VKNLWPPRRKSRAYVRYKVLSNLQEVFNTLARGKDARRFLDAAVAHSIATKGERAQGTVYTSCDVAETFKSSYIAKRMKKIEEQQKTAEADMKLLEEINQLTRGSKNDRRYKTSGRGAQLERIVRPSRRRS
jgi:hypothetical protein